MNEAALRHVKVIRISLPMLARLLVQGRRWQVTENGLPDDAVILGTWFDPMRDCWCLKVQSQSYPQAWPGDVYEIDATPTVTEFTPQLVATAPKELA